MAAQSPKGERPMSVGFIVVRMRSTEPPAVTAGPPCDRRRDIGPKFCHLQRESAGGRTVSRRRPLGDCWVTLRHCSRSRKSADELPISQNRYPTKIELALQDLCFLGMSAAGLYSVLSIDRWLVHRGSLYY